MNNYFHTCPLCGANLDPGEQCECRKQNKVFSLKKYQEDPFVMSCEKEDAWAMKLEGKEVIDGRCEGSVICERWCEVV